MKILLLGSGAREHALARALARDPQTTELVVAPGNPGTAAIATNLNIDPCAPEEVVALAAQMEADLVVVGPEAPLVAGVADAVRDAGIPCFGPSAEAARLEGSKAFAKEVMAAAGVPTAEAAVCTTEAELTAALDRFGAPYVVKEDGLAAGKGVVVTDERPVALAHGRACLTRGGGRVVVEDYLDGPEASLFCVCDGATVRPLAPAQDFKRLLDDDAGPNTGGMGAYTPLPWLPEDGVQRIVDEVCRPVAKELVVRGCAYSGLLYAGLAWGEDGPAVVEFNCRFGDPETQAVLAMLQSPLAPALAACANGTLAELAPLEWHEGSAVTVVLAAQGYPASPRKGDRIVSEDIENAEKALHGGTSRESGEYYSNGGRVLNVIGTGADLDAAREAAYQTIGDIQMAGGFYRRDIGAKAARGEISI